MLSLFQREPIAPEERMESPHSVTPQPQPPLQFSWKQRFLICIGLADPNKVLANELAKKEMAERAASPGPPPLRAGEIQIGKNNFAPHSAPNSPTSAFLEEAEFSEPSESNGDEEAHKHLQRSGNPSPSCSSSSAVSDAERIGIKPSDSNRTSRSDDNAQITMINR